MFALLGVALADAAVVSWDNKYFYDFCRPITAIRNAQNDGNDATQPDPEWSSFIPTPPFPSYTSGHSTFSGASAAILADFFGADNVSFTSASEGFAVPDRTFTSFSGAATEAMLSRLYGGIHWRFDNLDGLESGTDLGHYVFATQLRPVPEPSAWALLAIGLIGWLGSIKRAKKSPLRSLFHVK